jgi:hypothetical protein
MSWDLTSQREATDWECNYDPQRLQIKLISKEVQVLRAFRAGIGRNIKAALEICQVANQCG